MIKKIKESEDKKGETRIINILTTKREWRKKKGKQRRAKLLKYKKEELHNNNKG